MAIEPENWRDPQDPNRLFYRSSWESLVVAAIGLVVAVLALLVYCNAPEIRVPPAPPG